MLSKEVETRAPTTLEVELDIYGSLTVRDFCEQLDLLAWVVLVSHVMALKDDPERGPFSYPARPWVDPERYIDPTQHPQWTRQKLNGDEGAGMQIFRNAVNYFE